MRIKLAHLLTIMSFAASVISAQAQAPTFTDGPPSSQAGTNAAYNFTYTASGTAPITYSVTAGALPTGLTLSSGGIISGTPAAGDVGTTYTGTVTASNGTAPSATQNFSITVTTTLLNTVPEGVINLSFPGATTTYFNLAFTADPFYRGMVSMVSASGSSGADTADTISVADSPAPWTNGQFVVPSAANGNTGTASSPYLVKFLSGNEAGRVMAVTANSTNSLTLDITDNNTGATVNLQASTPFSVQAGDAFEIIPADTLGSVFGEYVTVAGGLTSGSPTVTLPAADSAIQLNATVTGTGIQSGTTVTAISGTTLTLSQNATVTLASTNLTFSGTAQILLTGATAYTGADLVNIYSPTLKKFQNYFFNTNDGQWELKGSSANANNTILYPYQALAVFRRGSTALSFALMGRVPEVPVLTKTGTSTTVYASSGYPVPLTLSQLSFAQTSAGVNWLTNNSYNSADILSLYSPTLKKLVSYYELAPANSGIWETKTNATNVGPTTTINPGDIVVLFERGGVTPDAGSFLAPTMPYTIDAYTNF